MTIFSATVHVIYMVLSILNAAGRPAETPKMLVMDSMASCIAAQTTAAGQADMVGLKNFSVACVDMVASPGGAELNLPTPFGH